MAVLLIIHTLRLRTHTAEPVPFLIWHPDIEPDGVQTYDEAAACEGVYGLLKEDEFMKKFMGEGSPGECTGITFALQRTVVIGTRRGQTEKRNNLFFALYRRWILMHCCWDMEDEWLWCCVFFRRIVWASFCRTFFVIK